MIVVYALNVSDVTEEELAATIKSIPPSIKDHIMTTYTRLIQKGEQIGIQKGEQIGIQKGEQIGIQKEKIKVVLNCFDQGIVIDMITNITGMTKEEVLLILKEHRKLK
ncbi:MAG: hypothetical protein WBO36_15020, partial [Saprospiraceae bacterium]